MKTVSRNTLRMKRRRRVRAKVVGTAERPRLAVFRSLQGMYVQVIDDAKGMTLVSANFHQLAGKQSKNTIEAAKKIGAEIAKKCADKKITTVVFDRGGYQYHGRVKALADAAREAGLKF